MKSSSRRIVGYVLLLLVLLFFFLFSPSRVRYVSFFLIGSIALTFLYGRLIPLFITAKHIDTIIRGIKLQQMDVKIEIRNRSFVPVSYFTIGDTTGELFAERYNFLVSLAPFERRVITYQVRGDRRGEYFIGPFKLKGTDPLGLFAWTKRIESHMRAIVYPTIRSVDLANRQGLPAGNININDKMYEDVTQFRSLREYVPGDDMKRINWKASAKTTKLYTMEFDSTLYFPVLIVLNFCFDDFPVRMRNQMIERAAEVAASLAFYYADLKQEIGFVTTGTTGTETAARSTGDLLVVQGKSGYEHAQEILELIAKLKTVEGRVDFNSMLFRSGSSIAMGTKVLVVTPRVSEAQARSLIGARRKGLNIQVLQLESSGERRDEDHLRGAIKVIPVKEMGQDTINE
jgi:uncharacterized protein (DUF58 family)